MKEITCESCGADFIQMDKEVICSLCVEKTKKPEKDKKAK